MEIEQLTASATALGKAGKQQEIERKLDAYIGKQGDKMPEARKAIISYETMKAYFTAAQDEAGAVKYAETIAAKYPEGLPMLCSGVERLKAMMVEGVKAGKSGK